MLDFPHGFSAARQSREEVGVVDAVGIKRVRKAVAEERHHCRARESPKDRAPDMLAARRVFAIYRRHPDSLLPPNNSQLFLKAGVKLRTHADIAHLIAVGFQAPPLAELILTLNDVLLRIRHVGREREVKILGDALLNRDARPGIRAIS